MNYATELPPLPQILIVDDDPQFFAMLYDALTLGEPRYDVSGAATADLALDSLQHTTFDLVLVDYRLAGRDGLELLTELRIQEPTLPVIMITGYPRPELRRRAEALGIAAFLMKPVSVSELRRTVQQVLKSR
ncbi:MAG TPA: response regulator [Chloroflexia bacterium]|nr:response regulator [Chloroflexia bacterium]